MNYSVFYLSFYVNINVSTWAGPTAGFILNPTQISIDNPEVNVIDQSIGATIWFYDMNDGNTSTQQSFSHTYAQEGEYNIIQIVSDAYGCMDTAYRTIIVNESFANAFSPNGDGKNDLWHPKGIGIDPNTWNLRIYDRWGRTVFVSTDINQAWDGDFEGDVNKVAQAVYSYHLTFKTTQGKDKEFFGHVIKLP